MIDSGRLYLLISFGLHLGVFATLFFIKGPQVPELTSRRVVIEFSQQARRIQPQSFAAAQESPRLPEMETGELSDSLKLEGPKTLSLPAAKTQVSAATEAAEPASGGRVEVPEVREPLLPRRPGDFPLPSPGEMLSREIETPSAASAEEALDGGITSTGALEWKGKERKLLKTARIEFPEILLEQGLEVDVEALFEVAASGQVIDVDIRRSSGYASVDRAVEKALFSYLFDSSDETAVDLGKIQFRFRLERRD